MDIKLKDKKENKLLDRTEIKAGITYEGPTPSNVDIKKAFGQQFKADEKLIVIKHVYTEFGTTQADVLGLIYKDEKALELIEVFKKKKGAAAQGEKKKEAPAPAEKPAEAPKEKPKEEKAEEKKEEAPKEEKKEEKPAEEKKAEEKKE